MSPVAHRITRLLSLCALSSVLVSCTALDELLAETPTESPSRPTARPSARPTTKPAPPRPTSTNAANPAINPADQRWLVMMYQDADDEVLEQDMLNDLNEAELVGSTEQVTIVAQVDRFDGGYDGDGDWTSTKRFKIESDFDMEQLGSPELDDLGEQNMADGQTLVEFVQWATSTYPADRYVLLMSDHGAGWPGGWNDPDPAQNGPHDLPMAENGDMLFLMELEDALKEIQTTTGIQQFDLLGFDACLMSSLEVYTAIAPYARYSVASEEVEPSLGWAYSAFLSKLVDEPAIDAAELANTIVRTYIAQDQQITDEEARAAYVERTYDSDGPMTAREVIREETQRTTLSSVDLAQIPAVVGALDGLVQAMAGSETKPINAARRYALAFETVFDEEEPSPTIDLGHFATLLREKADSAEIGAASDALLAAIDDAVMENSFGYKLKGANGMTIHFPNSTLYEDPSAGAESYTTIARSFAAVSQWDDFLAYHYSGTPLPDAASAPVRPPAETAAAPLTLADVSLSADALTSGETIEASTTVSGDNLAYVYKFIGQIDTETNAFELIDMDYIDAGATRDVEGVQFPDWGEGDVEVGYDWDGTLYAVDGIGDPVIALIQPKSYGSDTEDAVYTVSGTYTSAETGNERRALMRFSAGELLDMYGYTGSDSAGAMREITPSADDTFQIERTWLPLDSSTDEGSFTTSGDVITFGKRTLKWTSVDAPAGEYIIGFIAEDFDGLWTTTFTTVTKE